MSGVSDAQGASVSSRPGVSWKVLALGGAVLVPLLIILGAGFFMDPHAMPSPLVDKPAPGFDLARYDTGEHIAGVTTERYMCND